MGCKYVFSMLITILLLLPPSSPSSFIHAPPHPGFPVTIKLWIPEPSKAFQRPGSRHFVIELVYQKARSLGDTCGFRDAPGCLGV